MKQENYIKGMVMIILSAFFFACMNVSVRLAGDLPSIQKRKNNCKKRGQFIQDRSIGNKQMVDRIKVTEDSQCAERAAKEQRTPVLFLHLWYNMIFA